MVASCTLGPVNATIIRFLVRHAQTLRTEAEKVAEQVTGREDTQCHSLCSLLLFQAQLMLIKFEAEQVGEQVAESQIVNFY